MKKLLSQFKKKDENKTVKGLWKLEVYRGGIEYGDEGEILNDLVETIEGENLIVTVGKNVILDRLFGLGGVAAVSRIGVGTSSSAAAVGNTGLTSGVFKNFDSLPTRSAQTVTCVTTFGTADANIQWQELGMDNGTTLLNRIAPIGPFNKTSAVSIVVTVTLTQN